MSLYMCSEREPIWGGSGRSSKSQVNGPWPLSDGRSRRCLGSSPPKRCHPVLTLTAALNLRSVGDDVPAELLAGALADIDEANEFVQTRALVSRQGSLAIVALCTTALWGPVPVPDPDRSRVGAELRRIREAEGLSGMSVAKELGWSQSKVSRVETGRFGASVGEVAELLNYFGVAEEVRAELLASVARSEGLEGAWVVRAGGHARRQSEVQAVEARVRLIRQYQTLWVPGLLQSAQYSAAVARANRLRQVARFVERRQERQSLVANEPNTKYQVVIEEEVLRRSPGKAQRILAGQLQHLLTAVESGWVDLRVRTPGDTSTFAIGSFVMYDFRAGPPVVLCEAQTADLYLSAEAEITAYTKLFASLHKEALDADASYELIKKVRRQLAP